MIRLTVHYPPFWKHSLLLCFAMAAGLQAKPLTAQTISNSTKLQALDGDTFRFGGKGARNQETVRLLYIDTPERKHQAKPCKPYDSLVTPQATAFLKTAVKRKNRVMIPPESGPLRGNSNRLLVVFMADGKDINQELVRQGLALFYPRYHQPRNYTAYVKAEREAFEARRGIWATEKSRQFWLKCAKKGAGNTVHSNQNPAFLAGVLTPTPNALQGKEGRYVRAKGVIQNVTFIRTKKGYAALLRIGVFAKGEKGILVYVHPNRLRHLAFMAPMQQVMVEGFVATHRRHLQMRLHRLQWF